MEKTCCACKKSKSTSEFNRWSRSKDGLNSRCRECQRKYHNELYAKSADRRSTIRRVDKARRAATRKSIKDYLSDKKCMDCEYSNPIALDFDHLKDKTFNIADAASKGYSWERILAEIQKCEIVCANCHRIRTHQRLNKVR